MIEIQVTGIESVASALERLPDGIRKKIISPAMKDAIQAIQEGAINRVPVRYGVLKDSIVTQVRTNGNECTGRVGISSAMRVPIGISSRGKRKGLPVLEIPVRFAKIIEFGNAHQGAQPFLRPALDAQAQNAVARLLANINEKLDALVEENGPIT